MFRPFADFLGLTLFLHQLVELVANIKFVSEGIFLYFALRHKLTFEGLWHGIVVLVLLCFVNDVIALLYNILRGFPVKEATVYRELLNARHREFIVALQLQRDLAAFCYEALQASFEVAIIDVLLLHAVGLLHELLLLSSAQWCRWLGRQFPRLRFRHVTRRVVLHQRNVKLLVLAVDLPAQLLSHLLKL